MKKKVIVLLWAVILCCTLAAGCGKKNTLADGTYTADFNTDSSMFHVNEAYDGKGILTVENGQMAIHVSMPSKNIVNLYLGSAEDAENLMALVKQKVISADLNSEADILQAIEDAAFQIGVSLTDAEKEQILSLMKKIGDLDIDMDALKQQASDIYDRLKDLGVDMSDLDKDTIVSAISKFFAGIIEFFKNLFS